MVGQRRQSIENLKGEIEFRAKLSRQHVSGENLLPDYYGKAEHDKILLERVDATHRRMKELEASGINLSPFLELGAERGQRSLVLANDFGASGIAVDISYHQLSTMEHFSRLFNRERLPTRICCDANYLPFKTNSFPFVFCYSFLHHFPSLKPIVREIHRIVSDGYFFFADEPFKRVLRIGLYRARDRIYSENSRRKNRYVKLIESFICEPFCDEAEHGIVENNDISLREWTDSLSVFDEWDIDLSSINNISSKLCSRFSVRNIPNYLLGGIITGLCRKQAQVNRDARVDISDLLACPSCTIVSSDGEFDRPSLVKLPAGFRCSKCGFDYPCRDGIAFLLPKEELQQLYPDFLPIVSEM